MGSDYILSRAYTKSTLEGAGGIKGKDGFSPKVKVKKSTDSEYILTIQCETSTIETPNLKGGGIVLSVNGNTGAVNLTASDILNTISGASVQSEVLELQTEVLNKGGTLDTLETRVSNNENEIDNIGGNIGTINDDIERIDLDVDDLKSSDTEIRASVSKNAEDIRTIAVNVTSLTDTAIPSISSSVGAINSKVELLELADSNIFNELDSIRAKIPASKVYDKFVVFPIAGQSNGVGYGELPPDIAFEWDNRIMQLGRYDNEDNTKGVIQSQTGYTEEEFNKYRNNGESCNLKVINASPCLDNIQNMFRVQTGGTVGFGAYLAKELLKDIPNDYGVLLVPCCRGGSAFGKGTSGDYDETSKRASENATRWDVGYALQKDFFARVKHAMNLNSKNLLAPTIWVQGEFNAGSAMAHRSGFKSLYDAYIAMLKENNFHTRSFGGGDKTKFFALGSTKWMLGVNNIKEVKQIEGLDGDNLERIAPYTNYLKMVKEYSGEFYFVPVTSLPSGEFLSTNREEGNGVTTSTREIHFSTRANMYQLPKIIASALRNEGNVGTNGGNSSMVSIRNVENALFSNNATVSSNIPPIPFDISDRLFLHQYWTSEDTEILINKASDETIVFSRSENLPSLEEHSIYGKVANFNSDYYRVDVNKGNTSFTISFTIKPNAVDANLNVVSTTGSSNEGVVWFVGGQLIAYADYNIRQELTTNFSGVFGGVMNTVDSFDHYAITYNKESKEFAMYTNGILVDKTEVSSTPILNSRTIGAYQSNTLPLQGKIANIRMYTKALEPSDVRYLADLDLRGINTI